ncbi:MAG: Ig-like domain-containing protein, partial [Myxococcota bacterium]
ICDSTNGPTGTCEVAGCGDNHLQSGEGCDDGNTTNGDGCNSACLKETGAACNATAPGLIGDSSCATGICDSTNGPNGTCEVAGCGDNHLQSGEGCDDGNTTNGDGCNSACLKETGTACNATAPGLIGDPSCATGICDSTNGPTGTCEVAGCGDNHLQSGEGCDDGNTTNGDGCNSACLKETGTACNATAPGLIGDPSCATGICDSTNGPTGTCEVPGCGDNHLQAGEGCDDGNTLAGDDCNATCLVETGGLCNATSPGLLGDASCASGACDVSGGSPGVCESPGCGDGALAATEGCDDGNALSGDGCSAACLVETSAPCNDTAPGLMGDPSCATGICDTTAGPTGICEAPGCGDNHLQSGEGCDDGNTTNGDGCNSGCRKETGFACNATAPGLIGDASCATGTCDLAGGSPGVCEASGCGDGQLQPSEGCDDGNTTNGDGCSSACLKETGHVCNATAPGLIADSSCATGICDQTSGSPGVCEPLGCGDGHVQAGEGCDDGSNDDGDGCSALCLVEDGAPCNDGVTGETGDPSCASGVCDLTGGAPGVCEPYGCGDGHLDAGEGCDDGDVLDGDGCNAQCLVEDGAPCNEQAGGESGGASCASGVCDVSGGLPGVCETSGCGDGLLTAGEGCDDGNLVPDDGCSASCRVEIGNPCNDSASGLTGDGSCASGVCDVTGGLPGVCEPAGCGDGHLDSGEGCDDGGTVDGDGCSALCLVENGAPCNDAANGQTGDGSCASGVCDVTGGLPGVCETAGCGDGHLDSGEGCDDGGNLDGDGCSALCLREDGQPCNDGATGQAGDGSCASGVCDVTGGVPGVCEPAGCGDGHLDAGEACDDGNTDPGDGCDDQCQTENDCNGACPAATPICDVDSNICVRCLVDTDCPAPATCTPAHTCSLDPPVVVTPTDGSVTSSRQPLLSGTAVAGAAVTVRVDGVVVGTATADAQGNWSLTPSADLSLGAHAVSATATLGSGELAVTSAESNVNDFTIIDGCVTDADCGGATPACNTITHVCVRCVVDAHCPAGATCNAANLCTLPPPVIVDPEDEEVVNTHRPPIVGTSVPNARITVFIDGVPVGETVADDNGDWTFIPTADVPDGPHTTSAVAKLGTGILEVVSPPSAVHDFVVGCVSNNDCSAALPICNPATHTCVECLENSQCPAEAPLCGRLSHQCTPACTSDAECNAPTPVCAPAGNIRAGECVECVNDDTCFFGEVCNPADDTCVECLGDTDCTAPDRCELTSHTCVDCLTDADCPTSAPFCESATHTCRGCTTDADCGGGTPLCAVTGPLAGSCVTCRQDGDCSGATPICDEATATCRPCDPDGNDCSGATPACETTGVYAGRCVECTATDGDACVAPAVCNTDASSPLLDTCVECSEDSHCPQEAPVCNPGTGQCAEQCTDDDDCAFPTPICALPGNILYGACVECLVDSQCPAGLHCDNTRTDTCVECLRDSHCPTGERCDLGSHTCGACVVDAHCPESAPICDPATRTCRGCENNGECEGDTPQCVESGSAAGRCAECSSDADCPEATPICDQETNTCRICESNADCTGDLRVCATTGTKAGRCVQCTDDDTQACTDATPVCDMTAGPSENTCVSCLANNHCPSTRPFCDPGTHQCTEECTDNSQCNGTTPVCAPSGQRNAGTCVGCTGDEHCANGTRCDTAVSNTCVACVADSDCAGATPVCDPASHTCVPCTADAHCPGDAPVCDPVSHECRGCASNGECTGDAPACVLTGPNAGECAQCTGDEQCPAATPYCDDTTHTCRGCTKDEECPGADHARCDITTGTCGSCTNDTQCAHLPDSPVCGGDGTCVECTPTNAGHCGEDAVCNGETGECVGCVRNEDCEAGTVCVDGQCVQEVGEEFPDENEDGVVDEAVVSGSCGSCASSEPDLALFALLLFLGLRPRRRVEA